MSVAVGKTIREVEAGVKDVMWFVSGSTYSRSGTNPFLTSMIEIREATGLFTAAVKGPVLVADIGMR